jgi:serine/threonine-protein kinase RsbT
MKDNITWAELARLPIARMEDVLLARFVGRSEAIKLGLSPTLLTHLVTAISEITRNIIQHAGGSGEIRIGLIAEGERRGLRIIVSDKGKGIEHPERFLEEGKVGTIGAGLPGTRKLVDTFQLESALGTGTIVTMEIWKQEVTT